MEETEQENNDEELEQEDMGEEDIAQNADDKIDAMINLLIKKGIIKEEEYDKELDELYEDE